MNDIPVFPDTRPMVRAREYRWAPWIFAGVATVGGLLLFSSLESARQAREQPELQTQSQMLPGRALPDLAIPPAIHQQPVALMAQPWQRPRSAVQLTEVRPGPVQSPAQTYSSPTLPAPAYEPPQVDDSSPVASPQQVTGFPPDFEPPRARDRSDGPRAQPLAAPAFTVIEGTIIPAVLETALDSTRAGPVRAIVSRDVRGFDGTRVLVPRGSRLIGEDQADLSPGQARAMVSWTRLIRPDGVTVDLRAPATDALGSAGVPGRVNNHTMRRIGDALLQTLVSAGSGFSQRAAPAVVVVPGSAQQAAPLIARDPSAIQPTLTVAQGARVSVFVSQDLDFSVVDDPS
jgi:type IV secretion system protein VirB10